MESTIKKATGNPVAFFISTALRLLTRDFSTPIFQIA